MKILVTGGNGQLGLSLKKISGAYPHHEFIFTDLPEGDITDRRTIERLVQNMNAEVIVNCAAYTAVDKAESEPKTAHKINAGGAGILAEVCKTNGLPLVHISTDYVFDGEAARPLTEQDPTNPQSVYGRTKLEGEQSVCDSGCAAAIIRTSWLYSEFGNNFVKTMLRLGGERESLSVVADQKGTPTYAPDLAEAIVKTIDNGISGCELYHYSNAGETTWHGFATEILRQAGMLTEVNPITTAEYPTPAKRPAYSVLSKKKITNRGIKVPRWEQSLEVCVKAIKQNAGI